MRFTGNLLLVAACLLVLAAGHLGAESRQQVRRRIEQQRQNFQDVQEQLEKSKQELETIQTREREILAELDKMERELQALAAQLKTLQRQRRQLDEEIAARQKKLQKLLAELRSLESLLGRRLRVLYMFGNQAQLELLLAARDLNQLQLRWTYLRAVAKRDHELIQAFRAKKAEEERFTAELLRRQTELQRLTADIEQQRTRVASLRGERVALLQEIYDREQLYQRYVQELEDMAARLQERIQLLQRQPPAYTSRSRPRAVRPFGQRQGALPYPVAGQVVTRFGRQQLEKFGTTLQINGIELATAPGAPVQAVHPGQVLFCGWIRGYGNVIIIDHGSNYYTLSAHLSEITKKEGDRVASGETIGYAGYGTGQDARGRVYFEIRHRGRPLDPQAWLRPPVEDSSG